MLYFGKGDPAHIIYDGIGDADAGGSLPDGERLCIRNNVDQQGNPVVFGNLNFQNFSGGLPQGPVRLSRRRTTSSTLGAGGQGIT